MARSQDGLTDRRVFLGQVARGLLAGGLLPSAVRGEQRKGADRGYVIGEPTGESAGARVLAEGGNAVDALVAAALAAAIAAPHQTGIGGYGAHGIFAPAGGKRIMVIDGNSTAPAALRADTFQPDARGQVPGRINEFGWLAAGVPGILAALQLALEKFGTRSFRELVQPAIALARDGIRWPPNVTNMLRSGAAQFERDPGSRKLYFPDGQPIAGGSRFQNPELAEMLTALAAANSVEPFYRGDIALRIAEAFQKHGGLATAQDFAAYQARLIEPLTYPWDEMAIHTAPLAAGGLTVLQALRTLRALDWDKMPAGVARTHARLEALRIAWRDRLQLLGDPQFANVPQDRLLSSEYASECAERITAAVESGGILSHATTPREQGGTIHLSAADRQGNFAALTLTHGGGFGARVTVEGLGLTLGHGMSRFDPRPDHPNSPGPGKRPLHNMVPTIVTREGRTVLAAGDRGGRRIPNALFELLTRFVVQRQPIAEAVAGPRVHTEGGTRLEFEKSWPAEEIDALARFGYQTATGTTATLSVVALENDLLQPAMR